LTEAKKLSAVSDQPPKGEKISQKRWVDGTFEELPKSPELLKVPKFKKSAAPTCVNRATLVH
jgi:hypothetical protein